jgi:predicted DNA-binding transcriptional regulator AlpA
MMPSTSRSSDNASHKGARSQRQEHSLLDTLPPDLARLRILNAAESAAFWGVSLPQWRRLYSRGEVPSPIKLSERRLGWRISDLVDALAARAAA